MEPFRLIIDGNRVPTPQCFEVLNPADETVAGLAPLGDGQSLDDAVAAARRAYRSWRKESERNRKAACLNIARQIENHAEELAQLLTLEQGKPLNGLGSRWEVGGAVAWARYTASLSLPMKTLQNDADGVVELHRRPLGVVGSISPWNFPLLIAIWHIVPGVLTGNTVVCKPSPYTPLTTLRLVELINEVLPKGVVNCVTGADEIGAAMSAHPGVDKIVFTGSCATGKKIVMSSADTMKRLTLELGGNDAGIVLPDVDVKAAAEGLFWGAFINAGQTCAALKRLYVHDDVYEDVCDELTRFARSVPVGDGRNETSQLGPVQNRKQFEIVSELVDDARKTGRFLLGGNPEAMPEVGLFYPVTLVADMQNGDRLVDEEQFGPALPIVRYTSVDDAVRMANDSPNGLGGSVWGRDVTEAKSVAARLECGSVWINKHGMIQPNAPFGGIKASGQGVEFAEEGLNEYTHIQVVFS